MIKELAYYIENKFSNDLNKQSENFKLLIDYLNKNSIFLDLDNAVELLEISPKAYNLVKIMSSLNENVNDDNYEALTDAYEVVNGIDYETGELRNDDISNVSVKDIYFNEVRNIPVLSHEKLVELIKRYRNGDMEAYNLIALHNQRLVISIAKRYMGKGIEELDLIQEGNLGLMIAIDRFDYTKGYQFSTYATHWIRQKIRRGMSKLSNATMIPFNLHDKMLQVKALLENSILKGKELTIPEIADTCHITEDKAKTCVELLRVKVTSIDRPLKDEDGETLADFIVDDESDFEKEVIDTLFNEEVRKDIFDNNVLNLKDRKLEMLKLRFGIDNERLTQSEVADKYNVSHTLVYSLEQELVKKSKRNQKIRSYKYDYHTDSMRR